MRAALCFFLLAVLGCTGARSTTKVKDHRNPPQPPQPTFSEALSKSRIDIYGWRHISCGGTILDPVGERLDGYEFSQQFRSLSTQYFQVPAVRKAGFGWCDCLGSTGYCLRLYVGATATKQSISTLLEQSVQEIAAVPLQGTARPRIGILFTYAECGDGVWEGTEECDDGNYAEKDGCDLDCNMEIGFDCKGDRPSVCIGICTKECAGTPLPEEAPGQCAACLYQHVQQNPWVKASR